MLVYKATKKEFIDDIRDDKIDQKILSEFKRKLFKSVGTSEINSWCVFKANPGGTRQCKIVLVEHRNLSDPDYGGHYTVKRYSSTKQSTENDSWVHQTITLSPESTDSNYKSIELSVDNKSEFTVIGEFVAVIE